MQHGDELSKEKCLEGRVKFPPTSVICQKKRRRSSRRKSCIRTCLSTAPPGTSSAPGSSGKLVISNTWIGGGQGKSASYGPSGHWKSKIWSLDSIWAVEAASPSSWFHRDSFKGEWAGSRTEAKTQRILWWANTTGLPAFCSGSPRVTLVA